MAMRNKKINNLLVEVSKKYNRTEDYCRYSRFMLDCLAFIREDCPDAAKKSLAIADDFFAGRASVDELTNARVACLEFLNKKRRIAALGKLKIVNCNL